MNRDDPIALVRALDPADEKDVDALVGRLAAAGTPIRALAQRPPRRRRRTAWLVVAAAAAAAVLLAALVANPFSRSGTISSAQAKAQVARALDLAGGWHVRRITQFAGEGQGSTTPHWQKPATDDIWHAPDGRLVITSSAAGETSAWLYAGGERRSYDSHSNTLTIHRFVLPADLQDELRTYLPPSAADLYRAAYRVGKVHLAGIKTVAGRRVYRLAFAWLGSSYTLTFDADRQVPISSESRTPNGRATANGPRRYFFTRVRYTAYQRVEPGTALDRRLALPRIPATAKIVHEHPIVVPPPVRGASARRLMQGIAARYGTAAPDGDPARATYALVARVPGGGVAALAQIPSRNPRLRCTAMVEIAHPGGEARLASSGCSSAGGLFDSATHDGNAAIVGGTLRDARALEFRSAGRTVRAQVSDGMFLVVAPVALFQSRVTMVITKADGTVTRKPWPRFGIGDFASRLGG